MPGCVLIARDVPDILFRFRLAGYPATFSNPAPAKMVPGTGYLSRIVLGPFWQLVHLQSVSSALQEESLLNIEHDCSLIMQKG